MVNSDYNTLLEVLVVASSTLRGPQQQAAENQLKDWEAEKGYHFLLQSVYIDTGLSLQVRWLAVICLKNGIEKYWRPTRINAITKEEKLEIRKRLFNTLTESNNQLAIQNAHLVSRICRLDFPIEWPSLFEDIIQIMESCSNDQLSIVKLNNLMIMLNQILKILSTVRIGRARVMMQNKAPILFPHLIKFYTLFFDRWINNNNFDPAVMEVGYIFLKNIRRLIVDGYVYQHRDKYVQEFMELSLQQFQKLLIIHESNKLELFERYIKCFIKLYYNLVRDNTSSFILLSSSKNIMLTLLSLLQQKAELIYNLEVEENDSDFWEKIAIKSFMIMKIVTNFAFKENKSNIVKQKNDKIEIEQSIHLLKSNFFTLELVENLINLITNWYLKLRPADLENWENDPEDWFNEEISLNWEFQIRKCAENYFQDLSIHFNDFISQFIMAKIENLNNDQLDVITKDSILCIFQLSSNSISKNCDFNRLLIDYFIPLANNNNTGNKLIKRRVCLIINEWMDIKIDSNVRIDIYKFVLQLLNTGDDLIIKLTAVQTLKNQIDDWEFRKKLFQPFIDDIVRNLLELLNKLNVIECKIFLLNTLSILIERTNPLISDKTLVDIVSVIPLIWQNCNNANEMIIKNSLLRVMKDLTMSLNKNSHMIHDVVIPLIPISCDPKSEYYSLLCEDGLELWLSVLRTMTTFENVSSQLVNVEMFEMLINCLINWTEILPLVLNIIRSYLMISIDVLCNDAGLRIFEILSGYLKTMRDDSVFLTSSIIEISLMQNSNLKDIFYMNLIKSGMFNELVEYVTRDSDSPYCEIKVCLPLLRMMIDRTDVVLNNIEDCVVFNKLLVNMLRFLKNIFDPKIRKLYCLGLLSFYKSEYLQNSIKISENVEYELEKIKDSSSTDVNSKQVGISTVLMLHVCEIMDASVHFVEEIKETDSGDLKVYYKQTAYDDEDLKPYDEEEQSEEQDNEYALELLMPPNAEMLRYTNLLKGEAVHSVVFRIFLRQTVMGIYNIIGSSLSSGLVEELEHRLTDTKDVISFIYGIPALLSRELIEEYICKRVSLDTIISEGGLQLSKDILWIVTGERVNLFHVLNIKRKYRFNFTAPKNKNVIRINDITNMSMLRKVHISHCDSSILEDIFQNLPESIFVLEVVIDGPVKGKCFRVKEFKCRLNKLKMVTIINVCDWNRKKLGYTGTRFVNQCIRRNNSVTEWEIMNCYENRHKNHDDSKLVQFGRILRDIIIYNSCEIQNIGVFGIDAQWILKDAFDKEKFPNLHVVKVGGESLARVMLWVTQLQAGNCEKRDFANGLKIEPIVAIFSNLLNNECKVIHRKKSILVGGTAVKLFREYTYI